MTMDKKDAEKLAALFEKRMELAKAREQSTAGNPNGEREGYQWAKHFMADVQEEGIDSAVERAMERTEQVKTLIEGGVGP